MKTIKKVCSSCHGFPIKQQLDGNVKYCSTCHGTGYVFKVVQN